MYSLTSSFSLHLTRICLPDIINFPFVTLYSSSYIAYIVFRAILLQRSTHRTQFIIINKYTIITYKISLVAMYKVNYANTAWWTGVLISQTFAKKKKRTPMFDLYNNNVIVFISMFKFLFGDNLNRVIYITYIQPITIILI